MKIKIKQIAASPVLFSIFILISCNSSNEQFDSSKWKPIENGLYGENYRKKMLNDLLENVLKFPHSKSEKGTRKSEVTGLIDKAVQKDCNGYEIYEIEERQGWIDPNGYIYLKLMYDSDSTLIGYIIEDANYLE